MALIKDGQFAANDWRHLDDDAALCEGNISVSYRRWLAEQDQLQARLNDGQLALRLNGDAPLEDLSAEVCAKFPMIALEFPAFVDGRCFSYARTLRDIYGYNGEIRALGAFIRDQIFFLTRVGFNAFEFETEDAAKQATEALDDFSVHYQLGSDHKPVVRHQLLNKSD